MSNIPQSEYKELQLILKRAQDEVDHGHEGGVILGIVGAIAISQIIAPIIGPIVATAVGCKIGLDRRKKAKEKEQCLRRGLVWPLMSENEQRAFSVDKNFRLPVKTIEVPSQEVQNTPQSELPQQPIARPESPRSPKPEELPVSRQSVPAWQGTIPAPLSNSEEGKVIQRPSVLPIKTVAAPSKPFEGVPIEDVRSTTNAPKELLADLDRGQLPKAKADTFDIASNVSAPTKINRDYQHIADIKERITAILCDAAEDGFPLGTLLNHPFVWCWGRSQSGKTTIALMLAVARMAMGGKCEYLTTDNDYPRDLQWSRVEDSPAGYAAAMANLVETMSASPKAGLKGRSWILDELFAAYTFHGIPLQEVLSCVLMKGAKTGGATIGISQADTSAAHGLQGVDQAWRDERASVQAIHKEDELGNRFPTGCYIVVRGKDEQEWRIPKWMKTIQNKWGHPDPALWLMNQFPELKVPTVPTVPAEKLSQSEIPTAIKISEADRIKFSVVPNAVDFIEWLNSQNSIPKDEQGFYPIAALYKSWGQMEDVIDFWILLTAMADRISFGEFSQDEQKWRPVTVKPQVVETKQEEERQSPKIERSNLSDLAQRILRYVEQKNRYADSFAPSNIKQLLHAAKNYSVHEIKQVLIELEKAGYGKVEGDRWSWGSNSAADKWKSSPRFDGMAAALMPEPIASKNNTPTKY